jgi:hypothetical protein
VPRIFFSTIYPRSRAVQHEFPSSDGDGIE